MIAKPHSKNATRAKLKENYADGIEALRLNVRQDQTYPHKVQVKYKYICHDGQECLYEPQGH